MQSNEKNMDLTSVQKDKWADKPALDVRLIRK